MVLSRRFVGFFVFAFAVCTFAVDGDSFAQRSPVQAGASERLVFPLKASSNNRYLVDQNNTPFLMIGDSPHALIGNLSQAAAAEYFANRAQYGINTLWIDLLCSNSEGCHKDGTTFDGLAPFTTEGDLSTPNPAYFQRADEMIGLAAAHNMLVLLLPIETTGWLGVLRANGVDKAFAFGQWLGNRYRDFPNIIWMHGNDLQTWKDAADDAVVQAVARGIRSLDKNHIHTVELDYLTSGSLDDPSWAPLIELDAAYTYFPTYARVLTEYNRADHKPVFLVEANYEFEHLGCTDGGSPMNLRRQGYWAMLSGATGQVYGSGGIWKFEKGWETKLDSPGAIQLGYLKALFASRNWNDLVPDQTHSLVTSGYGGFAGYVGKFIDHISKDCSRVDRIIAFIKKHTGIGSITTNGYVTAAQTPDGSLAMAYLPSIRTITVDMSKLAGPTDARWYDPTNGKYLEVEGAPFANAGSKQFTPPRNNSAGDGDWILVLDTELSGA